MIKLWNSKQFDLLEQKNQLLGEGKLPEEVIAVAKNTLGILDEYYGSLRDPDEDLGGYLCINEKGIISECEEYFNLLNKYGTSIEMAEFTDPIMVFKTSIERAEQEYQWYLQLFILSSDFTLSVIYKDKI